jgi:hypothetical protein
LDAKFAEVTAQADAGAAQVEHAKTFLAQWQMLTSAVAGGYWKRIGFDEGVVPGDGPTGIVFADVSTIETVGGKAIRNGNVMYEVGMAHAIRQPEEVLLFRSNHDEILFDAANVRLNRYAPEEAPEEARKCVSNTVIDSLRELDLRKT